MLKGLDNKHKALLVFIGVLLLIDFVVIGFRISQAKYSPSELCFENDVFQSQKLLALNKNASKGKISSGYAYYKFNDQQRSIIQTVYKNGPVGITVRAGVKNQKYEKYNKLIGSEQIFYYGFLYDSDFDKKGKVLEAHNSSLCGTDLRNFIRHESGESLFEVSFSLEKNLSSEQIPSGILIYSQCPVEIYDFLVSEARIGFDFTSAIPFYGLAPNGGNFGGEMKEFDFSGGSLLFPVENTDYTVMPVLEAGFAEAADYGTPDSQLKVKFNLGGEQISVRRTQSVSSMKIQTSTLKNPYSHLELKESGEQVKKLVMKSNSADLLPHSANKVFKAMKTDPGLILGSKISSWRANDYEVYEWDRFPGVLFFDTLDYEVQSRFFTRLAFFAEKTGFRGRILTDEEIGDMHGYNAHDYSAETLARFFNEAFKYPGVLNEKELLLLDILITNGVIHKENQGFVADGGAVISISRESLPGLRNTFMAHEAWHGIFFINEDFRNAVAAVYYTVDENTMGFMKGYWRSQPGLGYDQNDEYLMHNEFMAYLMQQPLTGSRGVAWYFQHCANRGSVINEIPELCTWVRQTGSKTFEDAARVFDDYAFDKWGLACGRVALLKSEVID